MTRLLRVPARSLVLAAAVVLALPSCDEPPSGRTELLRLDLSADEFVVWQGFEHSWTHNHRWNRFGNWVEQLDDCDAARCFGMAHSAASGTSGDTATFDSALVRVTAPGVGFAQVVGEVVADDVYQPEQTWTQVGLVRVALADLPTDQAAALRDRSSYVGLLNGWDLHAEEDWSAAKPIDFALEVDLPRYVPDDDAVDVTWRAYLRMGCSTEECSVDEGYRYRIAARLVVLGWDDELTVAAPLRVGHSYNWDAPANSLGHGSNPAARELQLPPIEVSLDRAIPDGSAFAGLRAVSLHLFHWEPDIDFADQHMVEWRSTVGRSGTTASRRSS